MQQTFEDVRESRLPCDTQVCVTTITVKIKIKINEM